MNNVRQLVLAMYQYNDVYGHLPSATLDNETLPPTQRLSWMVGLLPYLEQDNLFKVIDHAKAWDDATNQWAVHSKVQTFQCDSPSFRRPPNHFTAYVGMAGVGADAATLPLEDPRAGCFGYERKIKIPDDFQDGTSNTLVVAETALANGPWAAGGPPTVRGIDATLQPYVGESRQFGGLHRGAMVVGMADGSVRTISNKVEPKVLEGLVTIAGGEVISDF
jgi:hypothetical protein